MPSTTTVARDDNPTFINTEVIVDSSSFLTLVTYSSSTAADVAIDTISVFLSILSLWSEKAFCPCADSKLNKFKSR